MGGWNISDAELNPNIQFLLELHEKCIQIRRNQLLSLNKSDTNEIDKYERNHCLTTFDGWSCFNVTRAGERLTIPCPAFVTGFDSNRYAFRECLEDGTWFRHPKTGKAWTNYTDCVDLDDLKFREFVNNLYICGYSVSFLALVISLTIFVVFRSLRCTRIAIHIHLFTSLAVNNFMWLIWYWYVISDTHVLLENTFSCQFLHILIQYLMVTNYMWMFCEGLHLHLALVVVFVRDGYAMRWFYFIGWILPLIITVIYAAVRYTIPNDTIHCWIGESEARWLLVIPVMISIFVSLMFLINVMRILLTKLHSNSTNPAPIGIRKAVRAALILIPLFGLHHILLPFRPIEKSIAEAVYETFSALLLSFQGLCVSILFCFANVDVHMALKLSYKKLQRTGTHVTHVTATTHQPSFGRDTV